MNKQVVIAGLLGATAAQTVTDQPCDDIVTAAATVALGVAEEKMKDLEKTLSDVKAVADREAAMYTRAQTAFAEARDTVKPFYDRIATHQANYNEAAGKKSAAEALVLTIKDGFGAATTTAAVRPIEVSGAALNLSKQNADTARTTKKTGTGGVDERQAALDTQYNKVNGDAETTSTTPTWNKRKTTYTSGSTTPNSMRQVLALAVRNLVLEEKAAADAVTAEANAKAAYVAQEYVHSAALFIKGCAKWAGNTATFTTDAAQETDYYTAAGACCNARLESFIVAQAAAQFPFEGTILNTTSNFVANQFTTFVSTGNAGNVAMTITAASSGAAFPAWTCKRNWNTGFGMEKQLADYNSDQQTKETTFSNSCIDDYADTAYTIRASDVATTVITAIEPFERNCDGSTKYKNYKALRMAYEKSRRELKTVEQGCWNGTNFAFFTGTAINTQAKAGAISTAGSGTVDCTGGMLSNGNRTQAEIAVADHTIHTANANQTPGGTNVEFTGVNTAASTCSAGNASCNTSGFVSNWTGFSQFPMLADTQNPSKNSGAATGNFEYWHQIWDSLRGTYVIGRKQQSPSGNFNAIASYRKFIIDRLYTAGFKEDYTSLAATTDLTTDTTLGTVKTKLWYNAWTAMGNNFANWTLAEARYQAYNYAYQRHAGASNSVVTDASDAEADLLKSYNASKQAKLASDSRVTAALRQKEMAEEDLAEEVKKLADLQALLDTANKEWAIENYLVGRADAAEALEQAKVDEWKEKCMDGSTTKCWNALTQLQDLWTTAQNRYNSISASFDMATTDGVNWTGYYQTALDEGLLISNESLGRYNTHYANMEAAEGAFAMAELNLKNAVATCKGLGYEQAQAAKKALMDLTKENEATAAEVALTYAAKSGFSESGETNTPCAYPAKAAGASQEPRPECKEGYCCGAAQKFLKDGTKLAIETCQKVDENGVGPTTYQYYPPLPSGSPVEPTPETWRFACISGAQKLAATAAAALAASYMMA